MKKSTFSLAKMLGIDYVMASLNHISAYPMNSQLKTLIQIGETFRFDNNSLLTIDNRSSCVSADLIGWVTKVQEFIIFNYGQDSLPRQILNKFEIKYLNGYPECFFHQQLLILRRALSACEELEVKRATKNLDSQIVDLIVKSL